MADIKRRVFNAFLINLCLLSWIAVLEYKLILVAINKVIWLESLMFYEAYIVPEGYPSMRGFMIFISILLTVFMVYNVILFKPEKTTE